MIIVHIIKDNARSLEIDKNKLSRSLKYVTGSETINI